MSLLVHVGFWNFTGLRYGICIVGTWEGRRRYETDNRESVHELACLSDCTC